MAGRVVNRTVRDVWTGAKGCAADEDLVQDARRGDQEAFALLYQRYKLDVWHLAWYTLRHQQEAEDALQETFLKAHRALGQLRDGAPLRPWLLTICRNACRDRLRAAGRRDALPLDEELAALYTTDGEDRERKIDFRRALAGLPAEEREAFLLVDVLGCHSDEAARIVGVRAPSTLRSRLARARRALAPAVGEPPEPRAGDDGAEVWGLYHSMHHSVVVVSWSRTEPASRDVDDLLARLRPGAAPTPDVVDARDGEDLVAFLDRLDRRIPDSRPVLAVVDDGHARRAAAAAPWLAGHPRWHMRRAPTHASWVGEVEGLLVQLGACRPEDRELVRDALSGDAPFEWTPVT